MNKLLWIIAFGLLLFGGAIIFYLKAPKGSVDGFKDKIAEILPWGGEKGAKEGESPELPTGLPPTGTAGREEDPQPSPDVADTVLPDGLPELPPVPSEAGSVTEDRPSEVLGETEESGEGDDFTVEIFTENAEPVY
jgi:hypothetical protein